MENTIMTPKQLLKSYFIKKGILLVIIFISATVLFNLIDVIKSDNIFTRIGDLLSRVKSLGVDSSDMEILMDSLTTMNVVVKIMQIIPLIPAILLAVGAWLIYAAGKSQEQKSGIGFTFVVIYMIAQTIIPALWVILLIVIIALVISAGLPGAIVGITIVVTLIICGFFALRIMYYIKFGVMFKQMKATYEGNGNNFLKISKYVIVLNWIFAIFGFFTFSSFLAFIGAALNSTMLIILTVQLKRYEKEVAQFKDEDYNSYSDSYNNQPTNNQPVDNQHVNNSKLQPKQNNLPPKEIEGKALVLFKTPNVDDRYSVCGEKEYSEEFNPSIPMKLVKTSIYLDSISGRKLLRMEAKRNVKIEISEIVVDVLLKDNYSNVIAGMKNVSFMVHNDSISEYALVLPDEATNGLIKITKIVFDDNLYWDKDSDAYLFYTKERMNFAVEEFLKKHEA